MSDINPSQANQTIIVSPEVHQMSNSKYTTWEGYHLSRGHESFPGWAALPFADFFECLDGDHKKMWLDVEGKMKPGRLTTKKHSLIPLYEGIGKTVAQIVSRSFFWYSASIVTLHVAMLAASRKYGVDASLPALLEIADEGDRQDLQERVLASRIVAFLVYEGDGLGGYSENVWKFWGRLQGCGCPTSDEVLTRAEGVAAFTRYSEASITERRELFVSWWSEIHDTPPHLVERIFMLEALVGKYQGFERGAEFNGTRADMVAAVCGFFRRSGAGRSTPLSNILSELNGELTELLSDYQGLSRFGRTLLGALRIHQLRNALVAGVNARGQGNEAEYLDYVADGLPTRIG